MKELSVFQVVLLGVFGALAIAGILIFALLVSGGGGNGVGAITIWGPLDSNAFAVVIRQLAENDPRLAQVTYVQKDPETYEQTLTTALAKGSAPDLFLLRQDYAVKDAGEVTPVPSTYLSQAQFKNTFVEASEPYLSPYGVLGIPVLADPLVMYWNRDMLASAGISKPPAYWDELNGMAQSLVKKSDAGLIQKAAVAFGEYQNVDAAKDIIVTLVQQAGGEVTMRDSTGRLVPALSARTAGSTSQAAESALRFYTEFADPSKADYSWNRALPESRAAFASGDLALYFGYASESSLIQRMNPNLNFAVAPMPQIRGGSRASSAAHVYALALTRTTPNPQGAAIVATILANATASQSLSVALGMPSARRDLLAAQSPSSVSGDKSTLINDSLCHGADVAVCSAGLALSWLDPDPEKTGDIFRAMIESITSGSARPNEAVQRADQEMAQVIGQ